MVSYGEIQPISFFQDAFGMGEGVKAGLSVIAAHAAFSDTTKGEVGNSGMDDGIIDAATAKRKSI